MSDPTDCEPDDGTLVEWARIERNLRLSPVERLNQAQFNPVRPGIDDGTPFRVFMTMADHKAWCATLPEWLGYGPSKD